LEAKPSTEELASPTTPSTPETGKLAVKEPETLILNIQKKNALYFEHDLRGIQRLLSVCSNILLPDGATFKAIADIAALEDEITFITRTMNLILLDAFDSSDPSLGPWIIDFLKRILYVNAIEHSFCVKNTGVIPYLIERTNFEDIFQLVSMKLKDYVLPNVQCLAVAKIFEVLDEIPFNLASLVTADLSQPEAYKQLPVNLDLISLALEVTRDFLNVTQVPALSDVYLLPAGAPSTIITINKIQYDPLKNISTKERADIVLKNSFLDQLFALLIITYVQSAQQQREQADSKKKPQSSQSSPMAVDTDEKSKKEKEPEKEKSKETEKDKEKDKEKKEKEKSNIKYKNDANKTIEEVKEEGNDVYRENSKDKKNWR